MPNIVEILITATNEAGKAFAEAEASGKSMGDMLTKVGVAAGVGIAAVGVAAIKMAGDYESSTTRLVTSAGESTKNIDMVRQGMLNMASQVGTSAMDLSKGMYTVESAGYHGAAGLTVLKAAAQGAKDENASLGDVANAVTDILKDYHMSASSAGVATSQMVAAVSFGKTNFELFSKALAQVVPIAAAAHIKFNDVSGVLAEMTAHGVTAQQAAQNIARAIISLEKPTGVQTGEFKLLGITSQEVLQHLDKNGLGGTLEWLSTVAQNGSKAVGQNYVEAMSKLLGTTAGLKVALMTTGENAKDTAAAIKGIGKATTDASGNVAGFSEIQKTFNFRIDQIKAALQTLMIEIGQKLIPVVNSMFNFIASHSSAMKTLAAVIGTLVTALVVYVTAVKGAELATKAWQVAQAILNGELLANPIGLIAVAIAALVVAIIYLWNHFAGFRDFWKTAWADIQSTFNIVTEALKTAFAAVAAFLRPIFTGIANAAKSMMTDIQQWWSQHGQEVLTIVTTTFNAIKAVVTIVWEAVTAIIRSTWSNISSVINTAMPLIKSIVTNGFNAIKAVASTVWTAITAVVKIAFDTVMVVVNTGLALLTGHWSAAWNAIKAYLSQVWSAIKSVIQSALSTIESIITAAVNVMKSAWNVLENALTAPFRAAEAAIGGIVNRIKSVVSDVVGGAKAALGAVGLAHGGIGHAAEGGARSNLTMVGEYGRELVKLPAGSRVYSNPDTERLLAGGGGGGGTVQLVIQSDGTSYSEFITEELKRLARVRGGGNLQLAIVGRA